MAMYKVFESANVTLVYEFEAESEDDAVDMVDQGVVEPKETDFFDYQVMNIVELDDAK